MYCGNKREIFVDQPSKVALRCWVAAVNKLNLNRVIANDKQAVKVEQLA